MSFRTVADVEQALQASPTVRDLHTVWEQRVPVPEPAPGKKPAGAPVSEAQIDWLRDVSIGLRFTRQALEQEEFLLACDAAREILRAASDTDKVSELLRVRMAYAAALTRMGYTVGAREELERIDTAPLGINLRVDVSLQLGDIAREESYHAPSRAEQRAAASRALGHYEGALEEDATRPETLVRVAATLFALGDRNAELRERARDVARELLALTRQVENESGPRLRTSEARATAHAILGDVNAALESFESLQKLHGVSTSQLAEARFRARFLAEALGESRDLFKGAFPPLQLIVFSGHAPDQPGSGRRSRLPPSMLEPVRAALKAELERLRARVGLVSASAGADLLFIEAMRERQGTVHVVLPWEEQEFRRTSVAQYDPEGGPATWQTLFDRALRESATIRTIGQAYEPGGSIGWHYMMEVIAGIALQTARASRLDIQPMVLWDGQPGYGAGGTDSFYQLWERRLNRKPINIMPRPAALETTSGEAAATETEVRWSRSEQGILRQEVKSMLFADIVGYSKLSEKVIPEFIGTFLDRISKLAAASSHAPCYVNTWGDAVYAVFDYAHDAGLFALELTQVLKDGEADWLAKGLYWEEHAAGAAPVKHVLNIRVGLHTGPVFTHYDPVLRRVGFTGSHVSRAARIEPVTVPGEVFASEEFAALATLAGELERLNPGLPAGNRLSGQDRFTSEYVGSMPLAKGYPGRFRIYRISRVRQFAIEDLAKATHERYCEEARARGETPEINAALRSWEELPEDLREANRALAADIPNKLRVLGYELAVGNGIAASDMPLTAAQIEEQSKREHDRWMTERTRNGWTYAAVRDNARKQHPCIVSWAELPEKEREKDRTVVRMVPQLIERAGFKVRPRGR